MVGVEGKDYGGQNYHQCRTYLSFDTSTIPALSHDISSTLKIKTYDFDSNENFTVKVWGGNQTVFQNNLTITDGTQPIYGSNLVTSSWGSGRVQVATWDTSDYQAGIYVNLSISSNQINKTGSTQFELNSTVEGSTPGPIAKYVWFYSGDCQGNEPKLEVTYSLDTLTLPDGETLFIRSNSTNKAVIILFGADNLSDNYLSIKSIDFPGDGFDTYAEKNQGKLFFLDALIENGFSVFTPSHDASSGIYRTYYEGCSNWVQDLSIWLQENQSYSQIFIFGFSGGGVVVGNEIQKDYASRFSAAVMNCAPVNWSSYTGQMWHTAAISSNAKVATCFPENIEDLLDMTPTFYEQMKSYYDNVAVDKEWHNWTGGHGQFFDANYTCLWHNATYSTGENNSACVLSWFNAVHHSPSYMRSDTQSVNRLSAYKLSIPQSASSAVNIQSGSGAGATWGIRAWIRHSNGVEQEIGLDGQTGTPQATVEGGSAGIRSSTVSVAQTTLQSTDSLVIRVYLSIGEGSWNLCATFTTEQLQSSTLKATTWTVYYYTWSQYYRQIDRTTAKFYWGTTTYNSRIQNIQLS